MKNQITTLLALIVSFSAGSIYAGKPVADTARFTADVTGPVTGFWTSKEYKYSDKTTGINFNASAGTAYLYFSDAFIHEFDDVTPGSMGHDSSTGHQCFGSNNLGGTAQIHEMGFGKDSDMVMNLWIHAPNSNPNDDEEIFYVLRLYNADEPAWDLLFPPDTAGSVNTATSWDMQTTSKSYLKHEPCLGGGDFSFPGGENVEIVIKRLP